MQLNMQERRYVCFDGDVDALWIENMNSVMDDNKLLTLANGERIRLNSYCALLFEVKCLSMAPLHTQKEIKEILFFILNPHFGCPLFSSGCVILQR